MNLGRGFDILILTLAAAPAAGVLLHALIAGRKLLRRNIIVAVAYYAALALVYVPMALLLRREIWELQFVACSLLVLGPVVGFGIVVAPAAERTKAISGMCRICGYNLTGNVSGRYRECGATVSDLKSEI